MRRCFFLLLPLLASCGGDAPASKARPVDTLSVGSADTTPSTLQPRPVDTVAAPVPLPKLDGIGQGDTLRSPALVRGTAPGNWYFEGQFLLRLYDSAQHLLGMVPAKAKSDWMTDAPVPFEGKLSWKAYRGPATLVLEADNPSGDPERDKKMKVPLWLRP